MRDAPRKRLNSYTIYFLQQKINKKTVLIVGFDIKPKPKSNNLILKYSKKIKLNNYKNVIVTYT